MAQASSVVDVILGEAGGRTQVDRWTDMANIASVIYNRSTSGRVSPQDVVAVRSEFNAYGKDLPRGVDSFRGDAEKIWAHIQANGPIHKGMFFATPAAAGNLPKGLQQVGTVPGGHIYFEDPQGRSFKTAQGYVKPIPASVALTPVTGPIPEARPGPVTTPGGRELIPGAGLANLAPRATTPAPAPDMAGKPALSYGAVTYDHPSRGSWARGMTPSAIESVQMLAASQPRGININSAYRPPNVNAAVGGARGSQHKAGNAYDVSVAGLSKEERAKFVETARMSGATRLGTYDRYPDMLHVDFAQGYAPTKGGVYAMHNRTAGQIKGAPDWFKQGLAQTTAPTPTARPDPVSREATAQPVERAALSAPANTRVPERNIPLAPATPYASAPFTSTPSAARPEMPFAPQERIGLAAGAPAMRSDPNRAAQRDNYQRAFQGVPVEGGMHRAGIGMGPKPGVAPAFNPIPASAKAAYGQMAATRMAAPTSPVVRSATPQPMAPSRAPAPVRQMQPGPRVQSAPVSRERVRVLQQTPGQSGGKYSGGPATVAGVLSGTMPGVVAHSRSDPSVSVMGLPGGWTAHTNSKHGWTSVVGPNFSGNVHSGKVAAMSPDGKSWGFYSPTQAAALAAKGWSVTGPQGKTGKMGTPNPTTTASRGTAVSTEASKGFFSGLMSGLFGPSMSMGRGVAPAAPGPSGFMGAVSQAFGGPGAGGFSGGGLGGGGVAGNPGFGGAHGNSNYSGK